MRRGPGSRPLAAGLIAAIATACASAPIRVPAGPWTTDSGAAAAFDEAAASCRGARTLSGEIAISGRAGDSKLRGRILAGFERPGRLRLEGVAPFGAPLFILAARADRGVLLLPRARRVLPDAAVADMLEALTGIRRGADDLAALLAGCVISDPQPGAGRRNASGWVSMPIGDGLSAFLRRDGTEWRIVMGAQGGGDTVTPQWLVEYGEFSSGFPGFIRLRQGSSSGAGAGSEATTDLTLRVSQRDVNVAIDPAAFELRVPADAVPMTLDELRQSGPLADAGPLPEKRQ